MVSTQFKLSKPGGQTRRIHFFQLPSWLALASKIGSLYDIPIEKIGVAYVDSDGDEVTVSSDDELQDFYANCYKPSETIKLAVQDLRSLRNSQHSASNPVSETPQKANYRNTFGGNDTIPMVYEVEDDWQRLSGLPRGLGGIFGGEPDGLFGNLESPAAYIEVLDSDVSSINKDTEIAANTTMDSDLRSSLATPVTNKGKGKGKAREEMQPSVSDDISSTGSVLVEESNVKFPVHVLDVGTEGMMEPRLVDTSAHPGVDSPHSTIFPIQAESTPIDPTKPILPTEFTKKTTEPADTDPPLPSIDSERASHPSFTNDVASFLNTLSSVLSSHPELSEGIRNITRNATNGTYWSAHRDAVSRAAEEFRRSATEEGSKAAEDVRRAAEEEAGRRVADALGGLISMFGDMSTAVRGARDSANPPPNAADASAQPTAVDFGDLNSTNSVPPPVAREGTPPPHRRFNSGPRPPRPGSYPPQDPFSTRPPPRGRYGRFGPPLHIHDPQVPFAPPLGPPHRAHWGSPFWAPPPPPPPPPPPHSAESPRGPPPFHSPFGRSGPNASSSPRAEQPSFTDTTGTWGPSPGPSTTPSPTELRAKVEVAKQHYKREKEMYRRAREERKAAEAKLAKK